MKNNRLLYIFLTLVAALVYCNTGTKMAFLLSGVAICGLAVRRNYITVAFASFLSLGYCITFCSAAGTATMFLLCGIAPGILLGIGYRKRLPLSYLTALPACGYVSGWVYMFFSYKSAGGENMFENAVSQVSDGFDESLALIVQQYGDRLDPEFTHLFSRAMSATLEIFLRLVPCLIILYSCVMALALVWFSRKIATGAGFAPATSFSAIYAPVGISLLCLLSLAGIFLVDSYGYFFMNILVLLMGYYMLCGVSLMDFFLKRSVRKPGVRLLLYIILFFMGSLILPQILWTVFTLAGMTDTMFDFRKIRTLPEN